MNTQLPGPGHARADVGRTHRGRALLAAAAASLVALTGLSGVALASDEDETTNPSTSTSSLQTNATEGAPPDETQPTGDAGTISSGTAGDSSAATDESATLEAPAATADPEVEANSEAGETTPSKTPTSSQTRDAEITPLSAGPDGPGVTTPYVYWTVKDANSTLIGGATFTLQGPRSKSDNWGATYTVTDCISSPCSGLDRDPDPGEFQVTNGFGGLTGMTASQRWQVTPASTASTWTYGGAIYRFSSDDTEQIPGSGNTPTTSPWTGSRYSFGNFVAVKRPTPTANAGLTCGTNTFYSVTSTGRLQSVVNGTVTGLKQASGVTIFNGLGIGSGGTTAYAYERSSTGTGGSVTMWFYDTNSGWVSTGDTYTPTANNSFVTGAVDLKTGNYYFGGFSGTTFYLYKWVPSTGEFSTVGTVDMTGAAGGNGDMAFDAAGDLYIVDSGTTTTVYSVTAATLAGASGAKLSASQSFSKTLKGLSGVNGMAFNTTGSMYLANGTTANEYDSTVWTQIGSTVTSSLSSEKYGDSTDLASCNSPANLTVQKNVQGRVSPSDQFRLAVTSGSTESGYAVTSGSSTGIQAEQVGPLPVIQGKTYTISETMASGSASAINAYASSLVCTSGGTTLPVTSGKVIIPNVSGASVNCIFTNSPLVANVTINKQMQDISGQNAQPRPGWTVGAAATATSGSVASTSPTSATQTTDANGNAVWNVTFGSSTSAATVAVSENMQAGYSFVNGSCTITKLSGSTSSTTLSGPVAQDLKGIAPGDRVNCTYTNKPSSATLTLVKHVNIQYGGTAQATAWTLAATGQTPISGPTGSAAVTNAVVSPGTYTLSESGGPAGYQQTGGWSCSGAAVNGSTVSLTQGANVTCTITNSDQPGAVTWSKTDTAGNPLAGSVWTLTGPKTSDNQPGPSVDVEDCVAGSNSACTGQDKNPVAGKFLVTSLSWGSYTLIEKAAPAGYLLDPTPQNFTIKGDALTYSFVTAFKNKQVTPPSLPLTGGLGTDTFLLAGGGLLALAGIGGWIHRRRSLRVQRA